MEKIYFLSGLGSKIETTIEFNLELNKYGYEIKYIDIPGQYSNIDVNIKNEKEYFEKQKGKMKLNSKKEYGGPLGIYGDILITSRGSTNWIHGHAAIVSTSGKYVIEAVLFGGVRLADNDWYRSGNRAYIPRGMVLDRKRIAAVKYAINQLHKEYEISFDKWRTDKFYCSQLVWRSWYEAGKNIAPDSGKIVTPADLEKSGTVIKERVI